MTSASQPQLVTLRSGDVVQIRQVRPDDASALVRAYANLGDPDLFFPISDSGPALEQAAEAKAICATCRVRRECLTFALRTGQIHGIWGGTTEHERAVARRRTVSEQPAPRTWG